MVGGESIKISFSDSVIWFFPFDSVPRVPQPSGTRYEIQRNRKVDREERRERRGTLRGKIERLEAILLGSITQLLHIARNDRPRTIDDDCGEDDVDDNDDRNSIWLARLEIGRATYSRRSRWFWDTCRDVKARARIGHIWKSNPGRSVRCSSFHSRVPFVCKKARYRR